MAGMPGRSGGARPGAGRKPKPKPAPVVVDGADMLELLQKVALGQIDATPLQVRAAVAAVQYTHAKKGEGGKREELEKAAERAASNFKPSAPPLKLIARSRD